MKIKKDGSVIYNSIDNTGSTDDASLGSRYAKGRLDSTDTNLRQNYYTKEEVQELISGVGRTKIVPTLFEDWYIYVPEEETTEEEIYYHVNNNTVISEPNLDDLPTYYRQWKVEDGEVVPVSWFISCANDTEIVEGQTYYTISLFGPTTKSTVMNNYIKAKIHIESNTYYFVGNDDDGYVLYYYDADFKEAIIGDFEIDFSQYVLKETTIGSYTLENNITAQNIQDDIKDLTATLTNKTIDADDNTVENIEVDNFKTGVVKTAMPASPADTELLSAKAIDEAKQDKLTAGEEITTVEDATTVSQIDLTNKKSSPVSAVSVWNYIKGKVTGAISGLLTENLGTSKALMSDANGKVAVSEVTSDELGYLSGTTSKIQTQIDGKLKKDWTYVGILSASRNSTIVVGNDWTELNIIGRIAEGSSYYNLSSVKTKNDFTAGSPSESATFTGFYYNDSYYYSVRIGLTGSGTNQKLQIKWDAYAGWTPQGLYIYKR